MRLFHLLGMAARRHPDLTALILLVPIVLMAAALRGIQRTDWDGSIPLANPDEYHVSDRVTTQLRVPDSFGSYLRSDCPTTDGPGGKQVLIAPLNPQAPIDEQYPSATSGCNSLNPRNLPYARTHVYGSLPTTLVRIAVELSDPLSTTYSSRDAVVTMGRRFSTWADLLILGLLFGLGRHLAGRRVGLLAALLYAWTPFAIQQAHFYTVDAQSAAWGVLTLLFCVLLAERGGSGAALGAGISLGLAAASKINMAALALVIMLAAFQAAWRTIPPYDEDSWHPVVLFERCWLVFFQALGWMALAGAASLITIRFAMPDVFMGESVFDLRPDPRFFIAFNNARDTASGQVDFPPSHQWANRVPWLYDWQNMVVWGMGLPLGLAAWAGWAALGLGFLRGRLSRWLPLWAWVSFYFWWQGGQPIKPMRYHLPIYGILILFGAWALIRLLDWARAAERPRLFRKVRLRAGASWLISLVALSTIIWGWGFSRIYTRVHPRAAAADWVKRNIPPGSRISSEAWDVGIYGLDNKIWPNRNTELHLADDEDSRQKVAELILTLDTLDYVALTSNRGYGSLPQMPLRFPAALNYYQALFDGSLGFEQVADFTSFPSVLGMPISDESADESWSVYDHPRVTIYRKTAAWSAENAYTLITKAVNFDETYPLRPIDISPIPTALQLTKEQWSIQRERGTWAENFAGLANAVPWLGWIMLVELLGLAAWGLLWRSRIPLPDRGIGMARLIGLLATGWIAWLPASLALIGFSRMWLALVAGAWIGLGGWALWRERSAIREWLAPRRAAIITSQLIYWSAWLLLLLVRLLNPDLWHPVAGGEQVQSMAHLIATLKSTQFPPYDPWFAGGFLHAPYWGYVLIGAPLKLLGLDPASGYNLALPTLFGLTAQLAGSLGYNLFSTLRSIKPALERRARRVALLTAVAVALLGNLAQPVLYINGLRALGNPALSLSNPQQSSENLWLAGGAPLADLGRGIGRSLAGEALPLRPEWRYWNATRIAPNIIQEFPSFSFVYGDLNPQLVGLPLALLVLALLLALWNCGYSLGAGGRQLAGIGLALGFSLGALNATNPLAEPVYGVLSVVTLLIIAFGRSQRPWSQRWRLFGMLLVVMVAGAWLPWYSLTSWLAPQSAAMLAPATPSYLTPRELFVVYGLWLWVLLGAGIGLARRFLNSADQWWLGISMILWIISTSFTAIFLANQPIFEPSNPLIKLLFAWMIEPLYYGSAVSILVFPLSVASLLGLAVLLVRAPRRREIWPLGWATAGLLTVLLSPLIVRLSTGRSHISLAWGDQSWLLLALAAATLLPSGWSFVRSARQPSRIASLTWLGVGGGLIVAALLYPLTAIPAKIGDRALPNAPSGLDGLAWLEHGQTQGSLPESASPDAAAIRWLQTHISGTPIILEGSAAAYGWAGRIAAWTGLPTLLGWDTHQRQQRDPAQASAIINQRRAVIRRIYTSANPEIVKQALDLYGVQLIYLGERERELYNTDSTLFDQLVQEGAWNLVYAEDAVRIYGRVGVAPLPAALPSSQRIGVPAADPLRRITLAAPTGGEVAVDGVADWPWLRSQPGIASLLWWLMLTIPGLLAWPISALALRSHGVAAWALSRMIGLLLVGWLTWFPVSLGAWSYTRSSILIACGLLALISLGALKFGAGARIRSTWQRRRRGLLITETLLVSIFAGFVLLRAANPDLWHPYWGGEKPFEVGMLSAVLRSSAFPPVDPFFSGGSINYYYYGLLLVSLPMKLLGLDPAVGVQFALASVAVLAAAGAWGVGLLFSRRMRSAALALVAVMLLGNLASAVPVGQSSGLPGALRGLQECDSDPARPACTPLDQLRGQPLGRQLGWFSDQISDVAATGRLAGLSTRLGGGVPWFWGPSRVTDTPDLTTINEFPAWSLIFADLHPHLIALPIFLLVIALAGELLRSRRWRTTLPTLLLVPLSVGALIATNAWDVPTAVVLVLGALLMRAYQGTIGWGRQRWSMLGRWLSVGLALIALSVICYLPFLAAYQAPVGGIWPVRIGTAVLPWLAIHGLFGLIILGGALLSVVGRGARWASSVVGGAGYRHPEDLPTLSDTPNDQDSSFTRTTRPLIQVLVLLVLLFLAAAAWNWGQDRGLGPILDASAGVRGLTIGLLALLLGRIGAWRRITPGLRGTLALATLGTAVALGLELVFIRDHLAPAHWSAGPGGGERMNTVFKFGFQVWVLWALAAGLLLPHLLRRLRQIHWLAWGTAQLGLIGLVGAALVFPLVGTISRLGTRFATPPPGLTLDGRAFMETASYTINDTPISLAGDRAAIEWLMLHVQGTPVVLQSEQEFYRAYGIRIAANTGLPTVISALHANEQRPGPLVDQRIQDVQRIYHTTNVPETQWLLSKYNVQYIYVGAIERLRDPVGVEKFSSMAGLEQVYNQQDVQIYQATPVLKSLALTWRQGEQPNSLNPSRLIDSTPELAAARTAYEANPDDVDGVFRYGKLLWIDGQNAQAISILRETASVNPNDAALHHLLGDVLLSSGDFEAAITAYEQAYTAVPSPENLSKLGTGFLTWGAIDPARLRMAEQHFRDAISQKPTMDEPHYYLGETYRLLGNTEAARQEYTTYLQKARPNGAWIGPAQERLAKLGR